MVHGSWLKGARPGPQGPWPRAPATLSCAMSHEPLSINARLIHELFDYALKALSISDPINFSQRETSPRILFWVFETLKRYETSNELKKH